MNFNYRKLPPDADWSSEERKPETNGVIIQGRQGKIFSTVYVPGGNGPKPVVVLCHGVPGIEQLVDFALYLQENGFCAVLFHYSGSWGSEGDFSAGNGMDDVDSVLNYVRQNENGWFDLNRMFVIGHSFGGMMATYAAAVHPDIRAAVIIMPYNLAQQVRDSRVSAEVDAESAKMYAQEFTPWLQNFYWDSTKVEVQQQESRFDLAHYAPALAKKPVLAVAGSYDNVLPRAQNLDKLTNAIAECDGSRLKVLTFETNHGMNLQRNAVKMAVLEFLLAQI